MKYINSRAVKLKVHDFGKRVSPSFLYWLDQKVDAIIKKHASVGGKTLSAPDAEMVEAVNGSVAKQLTRRDKISKPAEVPLEIERVWPEDDTLIEDGGI